MRIVGKGLLAGAMEPFADQHADAVVLASGVSDSTLTDPAPYDRELALLDEVLRNAARSTQRVVYFSSAGAVYGRWHGDATESATPRPQSPYGVHKVACEELIRASGARHLILRLPNVVGSTGNPHQLVPSLVAQVESGYVRVYTGAARDLVDVDDVGRVVVAILARIDEVDAVVLNVATGRATPAAAIVHEISEILSRSPAIEEVDAGQPETVAVAALRSLLGEDPFAATDYAASVLRRHVPSLASKAPPN